MHITCRTLWFWLQSTKALTWEMWDVKTVNFCKVFRKLKATTSFPCASFLLPTIEKPLIEPGDKTQQNSPFLGRSGWVREKEGEPVKLAVFPKNTVAFASSSPGLFAAQVPRRMAEGKCLNHKVSCFKAPGPPDILVPLCREGATKDGTLGICVTDTSQACLRRTIVTF